MGINNSTENTLRIERNLSTDDGKLVRLYLEGPEASEIESEYFCVIGINGGGLSEREKIYGVDQFQAVLLSFRHLNTLAQRAAQSIEPRQLFWEGGDEKNIFGINF